MVEGKIVFGTLLDSMAVVILVVILGLRDLDGTLGGTDALNTILLSVAFVIFIIVASLLSFTGVLSRVGWGQNAGH
ncbi:MAG: hypothetical protein OK449_06710 [Thaumarchaeota archaeon]|nr:hypothetical protein [Nitrososphaerota archaeon]